MDARDEYRKVLQKELRIWIRWWWCCWIVILGAWFIGIILGNING